MTVHPPGDPLPTARVSEFNEDTAAPSYDPSYPHVTGPHPPPTPKEKTQASLAKGILIGVFALYYIALGGLLAGRISAEDFKEVALALAAPLGLATAVAAFFFGAEGRK